MTATTHYRIDKPSVVSETIDGEAVILDLRRGTYSSTRGSGAVIWSALEAGEPVDVIAERLDVAYPDSAGAMRDVVAAFITELLDQHLIVVGVEPEPVALPPATATGRFVAPSIERYSDMEDLLLLDPIHDVEVVGWPVRKPTEALE